MVKDNKEKQATDVCGKLEARNHLSVRIWHPASQDWTQPGSSLWALIAYGHDLGCQVRGRPIPEWQEDPVLVIWVRLSGPRRGITGGDQVWWQRGHVGQLAPCRPSSQTGLSPICLHKVYLAYLGPGCFTSICSFQPQKKHSWPCWKKHVLPTFPLEIHIPPAILW